MTFAPLTLIVLLAGPAVGPLPGDLVGLAGAPGVAWILDGFGRDLAIAGFADGEQPLLLVAGGRFGPDAPRAGDLSLVSPRGWLVRRIELPAERRGLPALRGRTILAADATGTLHLFLLSAAARTSLHPRLALPQPPAVGPLVLGNETFLAAGDALLAVDDRQKIRWSTSLGAPVTVPPACDGRLVMAAAAGMVRALAVADGAPAWQASLASPPVTGLLTTAGMVVCGTADGELIALDLADGRRLWSRPLEAGIAPHLAIAGPWIIAATSSGRIVAVEATSGEPIWSAERRGPLSSPVVAFGTVFVIDGDGALVAVPFSAAQPGWRYQLEAPEQFGGQPTVYGRRIYAGTSSGRLVALQLDPVAGPAPWPMAGGSIHRAGRVPPLDDAN